MVSEASWCWFSGDGSKICEKLEKAFSWRWPGFEGWVRKSGRELKLGGWTGFGQGARKFLGGGEGGEEGRGWSVSLYFSRSSW